MYDFHVGLEISLLYIIVYTVAGRLLDIYVCTTLFSFSAPSDEASQRGLEGQPALSTAGSGSDDGNPTDNYQQQPHAGGPGGSTAGGGPQG